MYLYYTVCWNPACGKIPALTFHITVVLHHTWQLVRQITKLCNYAIGDKSATVNADGKYKTRRNRVKRPCPTFANVCSFCCVFTVVKMHSLIVSCSTSTCSFIVLFSYSAHQGCKSVIMKSLSLSYWYHSSFLRQSPLVFHKSLDSLLVYVTTHNFRELTAAQLRALTSRYQVLPVVFFVASINVLKLK